MGNAYIENEPHNKHLKHIVASNSTTNSLTDLTCGSIIDVSNFSATDKQSENATTPTNQKPAVPDGGYGWVVVGAAFVNFMLVGFHFMGFSLLYAPIRERYDASYAVVGWVGSLSQAMTHIPGFIYGAVVVKKGCRRSCMVGGLLASSGALLSAFAPSVYMLYISYGFISGGGMGLIFISNVVIVQQYFDQKRGLASAISMAGLSFGVIIGALLLHNCLIHFGWTGTMMIVSGLYLHAVVGGALHRPLATKKPGSIATETNSSNHSKPKQPMKTSGEIQQRLLHVTKHSTNFTTYHSHENINGHGTAQVNGYMNAEHNQHSNGKFAENSIYTSHGQYCEPKDNENQSCALGHNGTLMLKTNSDETPTSCDKDRSQAEPLLSSQSKNAASTTTTKEQSTTNSWLSEIFDFSLLVYPKFIVYCTATTLMNFGMLTFYMHSPSRALSLGIPSHLVALMPQATGVGTFISRILCGCLADCPCVSRILFYAIGILLGSLAEMTFVFSTTFPQILVHCVVFGTCNGMFLAVQATVLVDLLGVGRIAKSQALFGCFIGISALLVTPFAGFLYDVTGNYNIPFLVTGSLQLVSAIMLMALAFTIICSKSKS